MAINIKVNGAVHSVPAEPDTPLLYVLRNDLGLNSAKFGCGLAQCGACTVLVDGKPLRSCVTSIDTLGQSEITTVEGLGTLERPHPLQAAFMTATLRRGVKMSAAKKIAARRIAAAIVRFGDNAE